MWIMMEPSHVQTSETPDKNTLALNWEGNVSQNLNLPKFLLNYLELFRVELVNMRAQVHAVLFCWKITI